MDEMRMSVKRAVELAEKLKYPENAHLRTRIPAWIRESAEWAARQTLSGNGMNFDGLRLRYILDNLCPNLHHFCRRPNPASINISREEFNRASRLYFLENARCDVRNSREIIQEGVQYTSESFLAFCEAVRPYVETVC